MFRDGLPVALIDFDTAAPGLRLWDLGYSAFTWLDLGNDDYTAEEQCRRLALFAEAYAHPVCTAAHIAAFAVTRQTVLATSARLRGATAMADWAASAADWTIRNITEALLPTGYVFPTA